MKLYKRLLLKAMYRSGLITRIGSQVGKHCLTVLAYHRVAEWADVETGTYLPNVSATPAAFAQQMDCLKRDFNVIALSELLEWFQHGKALPPNPALITFDDGYRDNFELAFPILKARGLPAVIFLATDYIGQNRPFDWDITAYCFHHSQQQQANLPLMGERSWSTLETQQQTMNDWLAMLKQIPDAEKSEAVAQLPDALDVVLPGDAFTDLCLTWDQVRTMLGNGVEMGAHTKSHPILTRVSLPQAKCEIAGAKAKIEAETGHRVKSFAYPNGTANDFSEALHAIVQESGIPLGFTLLPAPMRQNEIRRSPIAIRRAFIHNKDSIERFTAKIMGVGRIVGSLG